MQLHMTLIELFVVFVASLVAGIPNAIPDDLPPSGLAPLDSVPPSGSDLTGANDFPRSATADAVDPSGNTAYQISAVDKTATSPADSTDATNINNPSGQTSTPDEPYLVADDSTLDDPKSYIGICPDNTFLACCPFYNFRSPFEGQLACNYFNVWIAECDMARDVFMKCCKYIFKRRDDEKTRVWTSPILDPFAGPPSTWAVPLPIVMANRKTLFDPRSRIWGNGFECNIEPIKRVQRQRERNNEYQMRNRRLLWQDDLPINPLGPDGGNTGSHDNPAKKDPAKKNPLTKDPEKKNPLKKDPAKKEDDTVPASRPPTTYGPGDAARDAAGTILDILKLPIPLPEIPVLVPGNQ